MNLGSKIRQHRRARDLTQEQLGRKVGMTRATINRIEKNKADVVVSKLEKIAEVLGVPTAELCS